MKYLAIFALMLLPFGIASAQDEEQNMAKVITSQPNPTQCIASIAVNTIDGEEVLVNEQYITLEPGEHSITGRANFVNTSFCQAASSPLPRDSVEPLVHTFEAGKTYWVGLDHSAYRPRDWKYVVWREE